MVKSKAWPVSARLSAPPSGQSLSLSLSLSLPRRLGPIKAGLMCLLSLSLADAVHPKGTPWILPRLDPGTLVQCTTSISGQTSALEPLHDLLRQEQP